ncbi:MAG: Beta-glucanase [Bacteroidetes bacterium MED-G17]|nr:MAG: Beta-glucanase [Bacteroidetes bacterium MED-G17]
MLGENIGSIGWPRCGEIDIMELVGGGAFNDRTIYGTVHWSDNGTHASYGDASSLPVGEMYAEEFHVFSIEWDSKEIRWYLDNRQYASVNISQGHMSEFHKPFHFLFNIAVGGNWPGSPDQNTIFPSEMAVDYIRVFQQQ